MKIAFLAPRFHTNQISLVKFLQKKGLKVSFYVTRIGEIEDHSLLKPLVIDLNKFFKIIKFIIKSSNTIFDYRYGMPSINQLLKFKLAKYDIFIIRDPINLMSFSYLIWSKLIGVNVILYIQREIHKKKSYDFKEFLEKIFIKIFNTQCISPCLGDLKFKKYNQKITYLPFCLSASNYSKKWFLNNSVNILTIGKFVDRKNHSLLIKALSIIKTDKKFNLTVVGECTTKEHAIKISQLKKEVLKSDLNVEILTNISSNTLSNIYMSHDLFVLPSINEPASISNLEAMAFGLPVITTDTNSTSCYTEDQENGYIVKSNDVESLSEKLKFLINNRNILKKFGEKSLNLVKEKYNPDINYKNFFDKLIKQ